MVHSQNRRVRITIRFPFCAFGRYFATAQFLRLMRNYLLLFAGCVAFHLVGTWTLPMIDRDEPRFAEASREMRQRQDYVIPYFNNQYRFDKPPLTYWAQVASYNVFGENDFAARFPSVIATALTCLCVFAWGSRIGTTRTAWWSAIIFGLCLQTFIHSKAAVADMWLVLFVTAAHWSGWEIVTDKQTPNGPSRTGRERRAMPLSGKLTAGDTIGALAGSVTPNAELGRTGIPWQWWGLFYVSLALAFLAKGPIGLTPIGTVLLFAFVSGRREVRRRFAFGRGLLLLMVIVALWGVPAYLRTNGEFLRVGIGRHVIGRSVGAMEGHGGSSVLIYLALLPLYFVTVFLSFFPWSINLPWLTKKLWKQRDDIDLYLICGIGVIFGVFTLVATKLPHYTLPAFPLLALLLARNWITGLTESAKVRTAFPAIAIATAATWFIVAAVVPPFVAHRMFPAYALFQKSRDLIQPNMPFAAVDYQEPSLVWYFRAHTNGFMTPLRANRVEQFISQPGPRFVTVPTPAAASIVGEQMKQLQTFSIHGFNIAKGKNVDLTLLLKSE